MNIITHNIKVALRNLMKYKLQTLISVVSIAIGIVTLSFAYSVMTRFQPPTIYFESYYDRTYRVSFKSTDNGKEVDINNDIIRAIKKNGTLRNAEKMATNPNTWMRPHLVEFHFSDSTVRTGRLYGDYIDPSLPDFAGLRSAITGEKIKVLKPGEAIVSEDFAKKNFPDKNPVGAVQPLITYGEQPIPITIVDVYKSVPVTDKMFVNDAYYYCIADNVDDLASFRMSVFTKWINVALKEGSTRQQLLNEINDCVVPLGITAELSKIADETNVKMIIAIRLLGYVIGSLILLAAIISFLRIQIQLFRIRRRELVLRLVNGATRLKLFSLLFTEAALTIALSVFVALLLGILLQDYCDTDLDQFLNNNSLKVGNLTLYSTVIGGILLMICGVIIWLTLVSISKSRQGLAGKMRRGNNRMMRNVMLGVQTIISIVFVCSTFILIKGGDIILKACNVPDNDYFYKECLYLEPETVTDRDQLPEELKNLPSLDKLIRMTRGSLLIKEIYNNPEIADKFENYGSFLTYCIQDTTLVSVLGMDIDWLRSDIDRKEGILLSEDLYKRFSELGLLGNNNALTIWAGWDTEPTLPIIGIIKTIPYEQNREVVIGITPNWGNMVWSYMLVPKPGKSTKLEQSVNETIRRRNPDLMNQVVFNYRERANQLPGFVEAVKTGGWILGGVSLIICVMSIFSTIALDTRARKKEVAIRKVNGAKGKDIYRLFSRTYLILILISLLIAIPLCVLVNQMIVSLVQDITPEATLSPVGPIILGCAIVILLILLIVGWQIHKVMQTDPATIIAKE